MCLSNILQLVSTGALIVTLSVLIWYACETRGLRKETVKQTELSQRPFVTVCYSIPYSGLKYKNSGQGSALNIEIRPFINGDYTIEFSKETALSTKEEGNLPIDRTVKNTETGETASPFVVHDTPKELKQRNIDNVFSYDIRYENIEKKRYQTIMKVSKEGIEYKDTREIPT
jgi:hypothetical protein